MVARERRDGEVCVMMLCFSWPAVAARRKGGAGRHPRLGFLQVGAVHGAPGFSLLLDLVTLVVMEKEGWVMPHRRVGLVWLLQLRFTSDGVCRRRYPWPLVPPAALVPSSP
jgi:hypothetical protein